MSDPDPAGPGSALEARYLAARKQNYRASPESRQTVPRRSRPKLGSGPESSMTPVSMRWMKVPALIQQSRSGTSCSAHVAVSGPELPRIDRIDVGRPRPADRCHPIDTVGRSARPLEPRVVPIDGIGSLAHPWEP